MSISISLLSACGGGGGSSSSLSLVERSNGSKLNSGTSLSYNSSNATTMASSTEFQYFNYSGASSDQNPLEVINANKAYGYGLTGSGETVAVMDTGFSTSHNELDSKTIATYGTITNASGASALADHGLIVSSVVAGEDDDSGMQGVAPAASLHLSSFNQLNSNTYYPTHWANATDNASTSVAQNNSWGVNYQVDTLQSDISSNSWNNAYGVSQKWNASGYTSNESAANSYITSLNNFQDHGVIVYALSNTTSYTDADFQAALPELFSQLKEAWITAVNVEITGTSGNETYTRKSAPCGSTASYCLGADGYQVVGAAYDSSSTSTYWGNVSGTSFVAPQISGAVALLAEAFPNHNPAQLTDRLLASADNSFFSHSNAVKFGNGVEHGFNNEFGHGVMDIYAALNPITTSTYTRIYTGNSINDSTSYQLGDSRLLTSRSFGDSIVKGLQGEIGYTYDDMDGGFEYDMVSHIDLKSYYEEPFIIDSELAKLSTSSGMPNNTEWEVNFDNVIDTINDDNRSQSVLTIGSSPIPVQSFFSSDIDTALNLNDFKIPYLNSGENGVGIGSAYEFGDSRVLLGLTTPIIPYTNSPIGSNKSITASIEYGKSDKDNLTLMTGFTQDNERLLGSSGSNALSLDDSTTDTTFAALKAQSKISNNITLIGIATIANSNMTSPSNSLVGSAQNVKSNSLSLIVDKKELFGDDNISFFVKQPNRIADGSLSMRLASLAKTSGEISYRNKEIDLEPTGRQLDFGMSYRNDYNDNLSLSFKHILTNDPNHTNNQDTVNSSFVGLKYKEVYAGIASNDSYSNPDVNVTYSFNF